MLEKELLARRRLKRRNSYGGACERFTVDVFDDSRQEERQQFSRAI